MSSSDIEEMSSVYISPFHDHPLTTDVNETSICLVCKTGEERGTVYQCTVCNLRMHKECVEPFLERPFLCNHFLKVFVDEDLEGEYSHCHLCRKFLYFVRFHCTICNISMDLGCVKDPLPLTIFQPKHHKHSLYLLFRSVTFTCNACGLEGDSNPYVCLECNFMVHKDCIDLPRVIHINRHDHRISHIFHLGQEKGGRECGVCRKTIDWVYGAFKCSRCPNYAVHSKCATREEVWDGIELEDVTEEEDEIEDPFKVINEKDIIHFSHDNHILRLEENCIISDMRCDGCVLPVINNDPRYKCMECDFILHKECASLPRKKRHLLHNHKLTLMVDARGFKCEACQTNSNGFRYKCEEGCRDRYVYDVRCSSISEPFYHDLHPHPLYWTLEGLKECKACGTHTNNPFSCMVCEYDLCMKCATLPRKVKNLRYDDHFLKLSQGVGNSSGDMWCDICETKTDPTVRYYKCDECGVNLHIHCVLGSWYNVKVGPIGLGVEVFANNGATRPICKGCEGRCKFPFAVKITNEEPNYHICDMKCFSSLAFPNIIRNR